MHRLQYNYIQIQWYIANIKHIISRMKASLLPQIEANS